MSDSTFIVDCPFCKAKVGAIETGAAVRRYYDDDAGQPFGERVHVGHCPKCKNILVGESKQLDFEGYEGDVADRWTDVVRVHPSPPKTFLSYRIPKVLEDSLKEADRSLQAGANIAACMMLGRALEALCNDVLSPKEPVPAAPWEALGTAVAPAAPAQAAPAPAAAAPKKKVMLAAGLRALRDKNIIDARLFDWSQQLRAMRNLAAHAEDISVTREDAEDLQAFAYAITEYIYDLTDRYEDFKERAARRESKKKSQR